MNIKKIILLFCVLFLVMQSEAQTDVESFYMKSQKNNNTGMFVLGSWAILNIASGAWGMSAKSGSTKYFYQMNLFWNTVNLGIAGVALASGYLTDVSALSHAEMIDKHLTTEKVLLINAGLDVLYMAGGAFMVSKSKNSTKRPDLLKGYGQSLLLQGGFLLVFDGIMYMVQHQLSSGFLENVDLSLGLQSFQLAVRF